MVAALDGVARGLFWEGDSYQVETPGRAAGHREWLVCSGDPSPTGSRPSASGEVLSLHGLTCHLLSLSPDLYFCLAAHPPSSIHRAHIPTHALE